MINGLVTLAMLIAFLTIGVFMQQSPLDREQVYNITQTALSKSFMNISTHFQNTSSYDNPDLRNVVIDVVYKIADTMLYVVYRVSLLATRFAVDNPQINYYLILKLILVVIVLMIIVPLIKIIIILSILIYDLIKWKKEKREIKRLKLQRQMEDEIT